MAISLGGCFPTATETEGALIVCESFERSEAEAPEDYERAAEMSADISITRDETEVSALMQTAEVLGIEHVEGARELEVVVADLQVLIESADGKTTIVVPGYAAWGDGPTIFEVQQGNFRLDRVEGVKAPEPPEDWYVAGIRITNTIAWWMVPTECEDPEVCYDEMEIPILTLPAREDHFGAYSCEHTPST